MNVPIQTQLTNATNKNVSMLLLFDLPQQVIGTCDYLHWSQLEARRNAVKCLRQHSFRRKVVTERYQLLFEYRKLNFLLISHNILPGSYC